MTSNTIRILYISGAGRSGSTLLELILGQSEHFIAAGELIHLIDRGFLQNQLCSCGEPFQNCVFWGNVIENLESKIGKINPNEIHQATKKLKYIKFAPLGLMKYLVKKNPELNEYRNYIYYLYQSIRTVSGGKFIIDSSKNPEYLKTLQLVPQFELYVIHLVRDSRAVAYSWTKKKVRPEFGNKVAYFKTYRPFDTAIRWTLRKNLATEVNNLRNENYLLLRYEDLAEKPKDTINKVFQFTEQGNDIRQNFPSQSKFNNNKIQHSVSGNPIRFSSGEITVKLDDKWKTQLSSFNKFGVTVLSLPYLLKYKYLGKIADKMTSKKNTISFFI